VTAFDDAGPVAVSCSPPSGSNFPFGGTTVSCTATNANGTSNAEFDVVVVDVTPPVVTVPADFTVVGPVVTFTASAVDDIDGPVSVSCTPPSGSSFLSGVTTVFCIAFDAQFNPGFGFFNVTVTGGAPMITVPPDVLADATGPSGAVVNYPPATATGGATVSCAPPSGSTFSLGVTTVTCTATNAFGSTSDSFSVNVVDGSAPVITVPSDITVIASSPSGAVVTYIVSAVDAVEGVVAVTCDPASGSTFPIGTTPVACTASDSINLVATASFLVNVINVQPPVLVLPGTITAEATGPSGAVVTYVATAAGGELVTCVPPSGSTFPLGTTTVNCSATNAAGTTVGTFDVTVVDTQGPIITVPNTITEEAASSHGTVVSFTATATDVVDGPVPVQCTPPSGSKFPLGTNTVTCTAADSRTNSSTRTFQVIVQDTRPPHIVLVIPWPLALLPANRQMVPVTVTVIAIDGVDRHPVSQIVSVTSNQPVTGGDDTTSPDWEITGPLTVELRAEHAGNQGRIYTIYVETTDDSGNIDTASTKVIVPVLKRRAVR
jgi:hypothetical protein